MKQLKLIVSATALTLALSFSAFAGQMETTFTSPQPTPPSATTQIALILLNLLP